MSHRKGFPATPATGRVPHWAAAASSPALSHTAPGWALGPMGPHMGAPSLRASIGSLLDAVTPAPGERSCGRPGTGFLPSHSIRGRGLPVAQPTGRTEAAEAGSDRSTRPRGGIRSRLWSPRDLSACHGAGHTGHQLQVVRQREMHNRGPCTLLRGHGRYNSGAGAALGLFWSGGSYPRGDAPTFMPLNLRYSPGHRLRGPQRHSEQPVSCRRCSQARKKCASCCSSACSSPHGRTQHS